MINISIKIFKTAIIFIFLLQFHRSYAQINEKQQQEIQNLWNNADAYLLKNDLKSLRYAKQASVLSEKYGDSFNKAKSYLILGRCLQSLTMYKESLYYLDKGIRESATDRHPNLKVIFKEFKGDNYGKMGLPEEELKEYSDIISFLPNDKKNNEYQRLISRTYARMSLNLTERSKQDSAVMLINKALKIQEKLNEGELYNIYLIKGEVCLNTKNYDSAYYYFDKSYKRVRKDIEYGYMSLRSFGDYYKETGNKEKALEFYEKSLMNMKKFKVDDISYKIELYSYIAKLSGELGDINKENYYKRLYQDGEQKVHSKSTADIKAAVRSILNEEYQEKNVLKKKSLYIIFIFAIILILISGIFYYHFTKVQRKKRELRNKFEKIIGEFEERRKIGLENKFQQGKIPTQPEFIKDQNPKSTKLISNEKEAELIQKLEEFEKSIAFTEKGFTQSNLAAILNTNTKYLVYILKEYRDKNFNDYINSLKIDFIISKLCDNPEYLNYKISYLSEISGFSSQSRFTHIFKQQSGVSPSEFIGELSRQLK